MNEAADNYFNHVTKAHILEAVRETKDEASAQLIDHLKKDKMALEADRLLQGTGYLPPPLRTPEALDAALPAQPAPPVAPLPDFMNASADAGATN